MANVLFRDGKGILLLDTTGKTMDRPYHIGVIGAGACPEQVYGLGRVLGYGIGKKGWILICGGLGGVMEGAAKGCREANGTTVGILPGLEKGSANPYISIPVPTGLGEGRNLIVVRASDALISVAGGYGTLSEIALALKMKKPVIGLETWKGIRGVRYVSSPEEAIQLVTELLHDKPEEAWNGPDPGRPV
jgi:uncharacterized protein (TIGR00725 family)